MKYIINIDEDNPIHADERETVYMDKDTGMTWTISNNGKKKMTPLEELPTPADEFAYYDQTYLGTYTVTWYSREAVGYDAPGASGNGLVPYYSCAMPDYSLLNCTVLVEGYGYFHVDDISPAGIVDLYVASNADIPGYGMGAANVYIVRRWAERKKYVTK